jgi:NAD-dependent deacetylase
MYFQNIINGTPIPHPTDAAAKFQFVYVKDIARMIIAAIGNEKAYNQIFNLAAPDELDYNSFLAELEKAGKLTAVITQNIDGLHQKAGSKTVLELHGSIHRNRCLKCAKFFPPEYIRDSEGIPKCECNGVIKPEVVLYEEGLDDDVLAASVHHIRQADTMIIAGTSLTVFPAAGLVHYFKGQNLVLINRDVTPMDDQATLVIHDSVGKVFSQLNCT